MTVLVEPVNYNMQNFKLIIVNSCIHFKKNNSNAQIFSKNFIENKKPSLKNLNEIYFKIDHFHLACDYLLINSLLWSCNEIVLVFNKNIYIDSLFKSLDSCAFKQSRFNNVCENIKRYNSFIKEASILYNKKCTEMDYKSLFKDEIEYLENYLIKHEKNIELETRIFHNNSTKCSDEKRKLILNKFKKHLEIKNLL
jgi:hypothetical protein